MLETDPERGVLIQAIPSHSLPAEYRGSRVIDTEWERRCAKHNSLSQSQLRFVSRLIKGKVSCA